jgi:peptidoglycan/xylan/chitin deacetylase (PgdA/CDA1 family)
MKSPIQTFSNQIISRLRLPQILNGLFYRNHLKILMYHAVVRSPLKVYDMCFLGESSFRSQMKYIKNHFEVVPLSESIERIRNGRIYRPTVTITFDDGYQNNYDVAFPILREARLPATIFLTTGPVNTSDTFWFSRLNHALAQTKEPYFNWGGHRFDLSGSVAKAQASVAIKTMLKELAQPQLLTELRKIILDLGDDPDHPLESGSPFRVLNHEAIADMLASGLIELGAHTHAILSRLSPQERLVEIERSLTEIHKLIGRPCELFAYPNGCHGDYDAETIKTLEAQGARAAVTAIKGQNDGMTPVMELKRYGIYANLSMTNFLRMIHLSI